MCLKISLKTDKKIVAIGIETKNAKITYKSSLSFSKIFEKEDSLISEINILMIIIKKPTNVHPQNFLILI